MEDKYEGLSDEELKEIFEDMEADYWTISLFANETQQLAFGISVLTK